MSNVIDLAEARAKRGRQGDSRKNPTFILMEFDLDERLLIGNALVSILEAVEQIGLRYEAVLENRLKAVFLASQHNAMSLKMAKDARRFIRAFIEDDVTMRESYAPVLRALSREITKNEKRTKPGV